jgi:flagellar protein FliO/FliZ
MMSSMIPSLTAFLFVVLMIPVALWLMRRGQNLRGAGAGTLTMVAGLNVGPRERIAVVRAADRFLVVGVTAQSMTLLATLDEWPQADGAATPAGTPFATLLNRFHQNVQKGS